MIVEFEGQTHDFPDNFSQDDIAKALSTYKPQQGPLDRAGQEIAQTFKGGVQAVTGLGGGKPEDYLGPSGMLRSAKETGRAILGPVEATLGAAGSGIASLGASGLGAAQRGLEKGIAAGTEYFSPQTAEKMRANIPTSQQAYETALPYAHAALGAVRAGPTFPIIPRPPPPLSASQQAVEAAARGGYTLPKYVSTEGTVIPQVASSLKNVPWGGQPIVLTHDELLANMGRSAGAIAPGAGTVETAGEAARSGLAGFIKTESQKPIGEAYKAVDELINPDVRIPLDNTREMIGQIMAERTRARIPGQSRAVQTVFDAVQDPRGMDYAGTKSLRSFLGEKSPMELASQGIAPTEVKRIYGAMSKDLGKVVLEAGGPEAFTAWKEANALTRLTKMQQQALSKVVGATGDAAPEMVFNRLATYANSRAGADLNRLRLAKKAMGPDAWNEVGSALISRLGRAPDETFSPQRFVTAFGNMAPAARNELFSGQQQAALADLFTVSKHIQDRITRFGNPSGTARGGIIGHAITGGALFADPISTLTTLIGARMASAALARPAVVRAATRAARASLTGNPYARERALAALQAVVQAEGLLPRQQDEQLPRMQYGGRPTGPTVVGEDGPEVFVPDRPGTVIPANGPMPSREEIQRYLAATTQNYPKFGAGGIPINPAGVDAMLERAPESQNIEDRRPERAVAEAEAARAVAAARTGHRGRQEGAGTQFVEGGYGIPAAYRALDRSAQDAFESAGSLQRGGSYDPAPVVQAALGATGSPLAVGGLPAGSVGAGVGPLWHGVSKVKLPRPISEMSAAHVPTGQIVENVITPEALQGGWLMPAVGDRSRAGSLMSMIGDIKLPTPVAMQGGPGFMPANAGTGSAWASTTPSVGSRLANQARKLGAEGDPVYFPYTAMGERSVDFSHHVSDAIAEGLKVKPPSAAAVEAFDAKMAGIKGWPGLASDNLKEFLAAAPGDVRNKFAKTMDTTAMQKLGLPSVAEVRHAVTDPRLLDAPTGASGLTIAQLTGQKVANPVNPHRTYGTQIGGQYVGGLGQSVPKEVMYPDMLAAYSRMGYEPYRHDYLMRQGLTGAPTAQRATQQWVDNISNYLEQARRQAQ